MPRKLRPLESDLTLHVTAHATGKRLCFPDADSRATFKALLCTLLMSHKIDIHAYALMSNHLHLLLTTREFGVLPVFMRRLLGHYAKQLNRRMGHRGQLWIDRYDVVVIEEEDHLVNTFLYIDANPWRAQVVDHPLESDWTSFRALTGAGLDLFLTHHEFFENPASLDHFRACYRDWMEEYLSRTDRLINIGFRKSLPDPLAGFRLLKVGA
jgi:putative transposase